MSHNLQTLLLFAPNTLLAVPNGQSLHRSMELAAMAELNVPFLQALHASFSLILPLATPYSPELHEKQPDEVVTL